MTYFGAFLTQKGCPCLVTREPGGTANGKAIRAILLDPASRGLDPAAELLLYMADRAQHLAQVVKPVLAAGQTVLCDRFFDATRVYQGCARGLDGQLIDRLHRLVFEDIQPDITFLLDLDPQVGIGRAWRQINRGDRTAAETRFEEEAMDFHRRVRAGYLELAHREPERFRVVDATRDEAGVRQQIEIALTAVL